MENKIKYVLLPQDETLIQTIGSWVFNEWGKHNPEATLDKVINAFRNRAGSTVVPLTVVALDQNDQPVGTASLTVTDMKTHPELTPWLSSVYILPEARGNGIATELCRQIEREAKRLGNSRLYLFTDNAKELYLKLGWEIKAYEEYRDLNVTIMEIDL